MGLGPIWLMQPIPYFGEELRGDWAVEPKIDGWRMQVIKYKDSIECWGRRLEKRPNWTERLGYLLSIIKDKIPKNTLLDTELFTEKGRRYIPSLFARHHKARPIIYVFDIVYLEGEFLGEMPLRERRRLLESLRLCPPFYLLRQKRLEDIETHVKEALNKGYEGIILKEIASPYEVGRDGPMATIYWRKIKSTMRRP